MGCGGRLLIAFLAGCAATALLFLVGYGVSAVRRSRRRKHRGAPRDPFWSGFTHAYGDASDLPALFTQMTADSSDPVWRKLWERLCHQGDAATTAGVAAVPVLVEFATSLRPSYRSMPLSLVGAIGADGNKVLVSEETRAAYEDALERSKAVALECLAEVTDEGEFAAVIGCIAASEGVGILAREVVAFLQNELQLECPRCDAYLTIPTESDRWFALEGGQDWLVGAIREDAEPRLAVYGELARKYRQIRLASWIDGLRREMRCPSCTESFVISGALEGSALPPG